MYNTTPLPKETEELWANYCLIHGQHMEISLAPESIEYLENIILSIKNAWQKQCVNIKDVGIKELDCGDNAGKVLLIDFPSKEIATSTQTLLRSKFHIFN